MLHIPPNLDPGIWTYQSLGNHSNLCIDSNLLKRKKENLQIETLGYNNRRLPNFNETFLHSKQATLRLKNSVTVSLLSN
ncbi:hypothetical protein OIU80_03625 [Flavobacterium sp. LS1R47]|uniref:Uncharacterized protein n=1 Tax=Flavobacterium frigoritolerans TaxID=2987686 RepID=A0A9X3C0T1_9FLAO|nr:hypothetical protein [Flavobacterium frigoritolerans]MCV9931361.1 hypothetical protein [Flavobacterium frigoritolerans]